MKTKLMLGLVLAGLAAGALAQTTYRWVDAEGKVHYSDQPPPAARKVEEKRFNAAPADTVDAYAVRKAAADFPVTLYTAANCTQPCEDARALLKRRGIPYGETRLATEADLAAYRQRFGQPDEVPALTVGTQPLKGLLPDAWERALDDAGYPRTAPPRQ